MNPRTSAHVVVAGEALVDLVHGEDGAMRALPGGSPFNVAVGLGRLGVPTALLAPLSSDEHGDLLAARRVDADVRVPPRARRAMMGTHSPLCVHRRGARVTPEIRSTTQSRATSPRSIANLA